MPSDVWWLIGFNLVVAYSAALHYLWATGGAQEWGTVVILPAAAFPPLAVLAVYTARIRGEQRAE